MKTLYIFTWSILLCIFSISCSDDESYLELSETDIHLDASGARKLIRVNTDAITWQISGSADWVTIERDSCFLLIEAESNQIREGRKARVIIIAGDNHAKVNVSQDGSTRAIGDPYPDAENPIGIIYKVLDGGEHGKVLSLDQIKGKWGPLNESNTPGASSTKNGQNNTKYMIDTYKDRNNFESDYPVFWWIHHEKNKGDINGPWYIPSNQELIELYKILVGQAKIKIITSPTMTLMIPHIVTVRDQFDNWITSYGGTRLDYEQGTYWSSSEYNNTSVCRQLFKHNASQTINGTKNSIYNARAIYQF